MAVVYVVDSSGAGDYLTIAAALAAVPNNPADIYEIQLEDEVHDIPGDFVVNVSGCDQNNYIHITAKPGAEPADFNTGAAIRTATSGHGFLVDSSYTKFSKVRMQQRSATSSSEMIRCRGEFVWADRCFVEDTNNSGSRDGFQCSALGTFLTCTNSVFRKFQRNGLRVQTDSPYSSANPPTLHSYHNTLIDCGASSASAADKGGISSSSYANNANAFCKIVAFNTFGDSTGNGGKTSAWRQFETQLTGGGDAIFEATNCVAGEPVGFGFDAAVDKTNISSGRPRTATEPTANGTWMDGNGVLLGENGFTSTQNTFDLTGHAFLDPRISAADFATDILGNPRVSGGSVGAFSIPSSSTAIDLDNTKQDQTTSESSLSENVSVALDDTQQAQATSESNLNQKHSLVASGTRQSQGSSLAALVQKSSVSANGTEQSQTTTDSTLAEHNALAIVSTEQQQTTERAALTEHNSIAANDTTQAQATTDSALVSASAIDVVNTGQSQTTTDSNLVEHNALALSDTAQAQATTDSALTEHNSLGANDSVQAQATTESSLVTAGTVSIDGTEQSQTTTDSTLAEHNALALIDTQQAQATTDSALLEHNALSPIGTQQAQTTTEPTLTEHTVGSIVAESTEQAQTTTDASIAEHNALAISSTEQAQETELAALGQLISIALFDTTQPQTTSLPGLGSASGLGIVSTEQAQAMTLPSITSRSTLFANDSIQIQTALLLGQSRFGIIDYPDGRTYTVAEAIRFISLSKSNRGMILPPSNRECSA